MERKKAIEVVKNNLPHSSYTVLHEAVETLIPELKGLREERGERIRKEIIQYIKDLNKTGNLESKYSTDWIGWLETQSGQMIAKIEKQHLALSIVDYLYNNRVDGCMDLSSMECRDLENAVVNSDWGKVYLYMRKKLEKQDKPKDYNSIDPLFGKSIDKVEPKFKVGDWIFSAKWGSAHIIGIGVNDSDFLLEYTDGNQEYTPIAYVNSVYDKWNIQDAKEGDVLNGSYGTFIFLGKSGGYCGVLNDYTFIRSTGNNELTEGLHPATKEQRDTLIKAMTDAGWEFDFQKKELNWTLSKKENTVYNLHQ